MLTTWSRQLLCLVLVACGVILRPARGKRLEGAASFKLAARAIMSVYHLEVSKGCSLPCAHSTETRREDDGHDGPAPAQAAALQPLAMHVTNPR